MMEKIINWLFFSNVMAWLPKPSIFKVKNYPPCLYIFSETTAEQSPQLEKIDFRSESRN